MFSQLVNTARRARNRFSEFRDRNQARQLPAEYCYSSDWFSPRIEDIAPFVEEFAHSPGLKILEIGSYEGRSAVWFLENLATHPQATLTCVDVWHRLARELYFDHNIAQTGSADKVHKIKGDSHEALQGLAGSSFSIVYIDGYHRAAHVLLDALLAWPLLLQGGLMLFDDYLWEPDLPPTARPQLAIDLFLELLGTDIELLFKGYMVIVRKRAT
jgi:predicted O-methyltransferase YrrM